jgi:hypothetical protein
MKELENIEGLKYDDNKLRWDLLDMNSIEEIVKVLTYGSIKYGDCNWKYLDNGIERYYAALMRHLVAWRKNEDKDPESGLLHLSHAACNLVFIIYLIKNGTK